MDVLPHPHIGLATVTYLFSGKMIHRDSIGSIQKINPFEVNWMSAGAGIVHSERVSGAGNQPGQHLAGLQTWVALPEEFEDSAPSFSHHSSDQIPFVESDGFRIDLILGKIFGISSPVKTLGDPVYAKCTTTAGSVIEFAADNEECGIYLISGSVAIDGQAFEPGHLLVFRYGQVVPVYSIENSTFMFIGGPALEKERFMYWNFVATSKDRIEAAKADWKEQRFAPIPGENEFIPLPSF